MTIDQLTGLQAVLSFLWAHAGVAFELGWVTLSGMLAPLLGAKLSAAALPASAAPYVVVALLLVAGCMLFSGRWVGSHE